MNTRPLPLQEVSLAYETKILLGWYWQTVRNGAPSNDRAMGMLTWLTALKVFEEPRSPQGGGIAQVILQNMIINYTDGINLAVMLLLRL